MLCVRVRIERLSGNNIMLSCRKRLGIQNVRMERRWIKSLSGLFKNRWI